MKGGVKIGVKELVKQAAQSNEGKALMENDPSWWKTLELVPSHVSKDSVVFNKKAAGADVLLECVC